MHEVASWLAELGLEKYAETFRAHEIDDAALRHLTEQDLEEIGLPIGPRRKVLAAIAALSQVPVGGKAPGSEPRRSEAGRRQLTVMFVDLVGSTELSQRLDPEEMGAVLRAYQSAVSAQIERYEGRVAKLMGDGVLAYFGWPQAHEDDAERAVHAGLAATAATAGLASSRGDRLAARVGIATGLVVVGELIGTGSAQEEAVVGETPNLAARLQAVAEPGTVVVADSTRRLIAGSFELGDLGPREFRGFSGPLRAWRVVAEMGAENRLAAHLSASAPLVGRTEELQILLQRWQQVCDGKGQVLLLSGEPGIGKSRLTAALVERTAAPPEACVRYFCSAFHVNSPLHPVLRQLERAAGLTRDEGDSTKLEKLEKLFSKRLGHEEIALLAQLLSVDIATRHTLPKLSPQAQKVRSLAALQRHIEELATFNPVLLLLEDAHWMDPTTGEFLDELIQRLQDLRIFLIVTFRPEFQPRWTLYSHVTTMTLSRLGPEQGRSIIDYVAQGRTLPPEIQNQILAKTEGVPLFIEELTKTVLESGFLKERAGDLVLSAPLTDFAIPSTIQDSLMARLDRLAPVRELAQIGACIGRVFDYPVLAAVSGLQDGQLIRGLQELEQSELVFRRGVPPEASYSFKHALVQDAAYQSLLKSRRQQIHAAIALILVTDFAELVEAEPETVALHYTAAGNAEQAIAYWLKAGRKSLKRSANREAAAQLGKGIELVQSLPRSAERLRQEIELQTALGVSMMAARGWGAPEVLQAFSTARKLSEELGDADQLFVAVRGEATYRLISGNFRVADELGRQCLGLAEASGHPDLLLEAHHQMWATKYYLGDYKAARAHLDYGIANYDPERDHRLTYIYTGHDPGICCRNFVSDTLWILGYPDQAVAHGQEAVALARKVSHPLTLAQALSNKSDLHLMRGEMDEGRRWAEQAMALAHEFGFPFVLSQARFRYGLALIGQGHVEEGLREMRESVAAVTAAGAAMNIPFLLCEMGSACGMYGDSAEGLALIDRGLAMVEESGSRHYKAELTRVRGELLFRLNAEDGSAEACFLAAIAAARDCGSRTFELRAATSLARLWRGQGKAAEAEDLLTPICAWFTEGFATTDLKNAELLLRELRDRGFHAISPIPSN